MKANKPISCCFVMGLSEKKNGITKDNTIPLKGKRDLFITDIDYFVKNYKSMVIKAKELIKLRDAGNIYIKEKNYVSRANELWVINEDGRMSYPYACYH